MLSLPDPLFFIALLPAEDIQAEVTRFKEYAAEHFGSARALRSPPHLTLIPPFNWPEGRVGELGEALEPFAAQERPFPLRLHNFNCFAPRVIFVDVERKDELLGLRNRLEAYLEENLGLKPKGRREYNPHMTVAFKDLQRKAFPGAWAYFSRLQYEREFAVDALALLRHSGRKWEVSEQFGFGAEGVAG